MSDLWERYDDENRGLDRQYYLSKIDELIRCLPVVAAAKAWVDDNRDDCYQDDTESGYRGRTLMEAVDAFDGKEEADSE